MSEHDEVGGTVVELMLREPEIVAWLADYRPKAGGLDDYRPEPGETEDDEPPRAA